MFICWYYTRQPLYFFTIHIYAVQDDLIAVESSYMCNGGKAANMFGKIAAKLLRIADPASTVARDIDAV